MIAQSQVARRAARFVEASLGVPWTELVSARRQAPLVRARMLFVWCLRWSKPTMSYPAIGHWLARDHTSIIHLARRAEETIHRDREFAELCEQWRAAERATMEVPHACA